MLFCVVEIENSNHIDIVPSNWLVPFDDDVSQATAAYWPPFKDQLKKSGVVKNCESPSTEWKRYMIHQIIHQVGLIISIALNTWAVCFYCTGFLLLFWRMLTILLEQNQLVKNFYEACFSCQLLLLWFWSTQLGCIFSMAYGQGWSKPFQCPRQDRFSAPLYSLKEVFALRWHNSIAGASWARSVRSIPAPLTEKDPMLYIRCRYDQYLQQLNKNIVYTRLWQWAGCNKVLSPMLDFFFTGTLQCLLLV